MFMAFQAIVVARSSCRSASVMGRTLDFEHRDGGVHLGQDFDRHRSVSLWLVRRAFGHPHGSNDQNLWMALGEVT
jgi:hypothetical protein